MNRRRAKLMVNAARVLNDMGKCIIIAGTIGTIIFSCMLDSEGDAFRYVIRLLIASILSIIAGGLMLYYKQDLMSQVTTYGRA